MKINEMPQTSDISKNGYLIYSDDGVDSKKASINDTSDVVRDLYKKSTSAYSNNEEASELITSLISWSSQPSETGYELVAYGDETDMGAERCGNKDINENVFRLNTSAGSSLCTSRPEMMTNGMHTSPSSTLIAGGSLTADLFLIPVRMSDYFSNVRGFENREILNWPLFKCVMMRTQLIQGEHSPVATFTNLYAEGYDDTVPKRSDYGTESEWEAAADAWIVDKNANGLGYDYRRDGTFLYSLFMEEQATETKPAKYFKPEPGKYDFIVDVDMYNLDGTDDYLQLDVWECLVAPSLYREYIAKWDLDSVISISEWVYADESLILLSGGRSYRNTYSSGQALIDDIMQQFQDFGVMLYYYALYDGAVYAYTYQPLFQFIPGLYNCLLTAHFINGDFGLNDLGGFKLYHYPADYIPPGPGFVHRFIKVDWPEYYLSGGMPVNIPAKINTPQFSTYIEFPQNKLTLYGRYIYDFNFGDTGPNQTFFMNYAPGIFDFEHVAISNPYGTDPVIEVEGTPYEDYIISLIEAGGGLTQLGIENEDPYESINHSVTIPLLNQYNVVPRRSSGETYIGMLQSYFDTLQPKLSQGFNVFLYNDGTIETNQLVQDILFNDQSIVDPVTHIADVDSYTVGETIHECIPIDSDSMDISMEVEYDPSTLKCTKVYTPNVSSGIKPADIVQTEPDIYIIDSSNVGNLYHTLDYVDIHAGEKALITFTACTFTAPDIVMIAYIDGGIALNPLPTGSLFTTGFTDYDIGVNRGICTKLKVVKVVEPDQDTRYNMRFIQNMTAAQMGSGEMNVFHTVNVKYLVNT